MEEHNEGSTIVGFTAGAYRTMFGVEIDVYNNPLTSWAQATVSREQSNFEETKKEALRLLNGVQDSLYKKNQDEHLSELAELEDRLKATTTITAFGQEIRDASDLLDKTLTPPPAE